MSVNDHIPSSNLKSRLAALGPGLLMASAAVGGSHLVASTQAGALYGWQLAIIIILANLLKYPFFRFSAHYTLTTGKSLVAGYAERSRWYLWVFFVLCIVSAMISTGAVALLSGVILKIALPASWGLSVPQLTIGVLVVTLLLLWVGHYRALSGVTKIIMISLTLTTLLAVGVAAAKGSQMQADFIEPSPWHLASLGFIVALMGWMPAPMEITAINSMWVSAKQRIAPSNYTDGLFDFNVGYIVSALLAVVFLALGALVQYGTGVNVEAAGPKYIGQLVGMYAANIGDWSKLLVAFIAFACMFGTTLTVADGYGRINNEALRLLRNTPISQSPWGLNLWIGWSVLSGLVLVLFFNSELKTLLNFAMVSAFLTAPVFAWLNYSLVRNTDKQAVGGWLGALSIAGLIYLLGFALLFIWHFFMR